MAEVLSIMRIARADDSCCRRERSGIRHVGGREGRRVGLRLLLLLLAPSQGRRRPLLVLVLTPRQQRRLRA